MEDMRRTQKRTFKTPCCGTITTVWFPRGRSIVKFECLECNKFFKIQYAIKSTKTGASCGQMIKKFVIEEN